MTEVRFDLTGHLSLWSWCIKNPSKEKSEWPGWKRNGGKYEDQPFDCFACGYDAQFEGPRCASCPLTGRDEKRRCLGGLVRWYKTSLGLSYDRALFAELIRDLPVRPGVKCK